MVQSSLHHAVTSSARHWRRTKTLTFCLLLVWGLVTFLVVFFARELSSLTLFGWPLSFYMAAQGLVVVYLFIVVIYTWQMQRFDRDAALEGALEAALKAALEARDLTSQSIQPSQPTQVNRVDYEK